MNLRRPLIISTLTVLEIAGKGVIHGLKVLEQKEVRQYNTTNMMVGKQMDSGKPNLWSGVQTIICLRNHTAQSSPACLSCSLFLVEKKCQIVARISLRASICKVFQCPYRFLGLGGDGRRRSAGRHDALASEILDAKEKQRKITGEMILSRYAHEMGSGEGGGQPMQKNFDISWSKLERFKMDCEQQS